MAIRPHHGHDHAVLNGAASATASEHARAIVRLRSAELRTFCIHLHKVLATCRLCRPCAQLLLDNAAFSPSILDLVTACFDLFYLFEGCS